VELRALRLLAPAAALAAGVLPVPPASAAKAPRVGGVRCIADCGGLRTGAVGSTLRWTGRHLAHVATVEFPSRSGGRTSAKPIASGSRRVTARIPSGAGNGRPALVTPGRRRGFAKAPVYVVKPGKLVPRHALSLMESKAHPRVAFFDGRRVHIRYRFRARSLSDIKINIVRRATGGVVAHMRRRNVAPFSPHALRWDGTRSNGRVVPPGSYALRVGLAHGHGDTGARFTMLPDEFPVRGSHSYGGSLQRFGAPRSGGRVHQGQDVFAPCGTREVAARGGRVTHTGYDPVLYGYWLVIDGRGTSTDYRYAHLIAPTPLHSGDRVRTGELVGHVGRTGNARTVGCMLHFEEWPQGWEVGNPVDPLPDLERWDGWS
jgi:murein DD-endopeptidase MepM/ murein hydrolase activator NlpD